MSAAMSDPIQNALKLPDTMPDRIVSEAPPSRVAVTISCTCLECELVKILVNSGMSTAASVPQLMMAASCAHSHCVWDGSIPGTTSPRISSQLMKNDVLMHRIAAIQMSRVSGCSKSNSVRWPYCFSEMAWLMKYDTPDMKSIKKRIAKIQTISLAWMSMLLTARVMKAMRATPVTPYVSKPSAVGPTESPALSPVQSAMTPGLRGSSSFTLKTIFIRSEPMSAILVKIPPAMRRAEAPSDSPMAKPRKPMPTIWRSTKSRMMTIITSSSEIRNRPIDIPARRGILTTSQGSPRRAANAVRALANVLTRIPYHATAYDPAIPT